MTEDELIEIWGPGKYQEGFGGHFRIFGINIGDSLQECIQILKSNGFKTIGNEEKIFVNGEYYISLSGQENVESIQLSFSDKDLRDRSY